MEHCIAYHCPLGRMWISATHDGITGIRWEDERPAAATEGGTELLRRAAAQLDEYFAGRRRGFDLPLSPAGTPFQRRVWEALAAIPYGQTRSYGDIARAVGNPRASRAVGMANNRNPLSIVVPCHRVIGSSGHLTGYAGGLERKTFLLELEAKDR